LGPEFEDPVRQLIGVVGDTRDNGLDSDPPPMVVVASAQVPDGLATLGNSLIPPRWIVKSQAPLSSLTGPIQQAFLAVDAQLPLAAIKPMDAIVSPSIGRQKLQML